MTTGRRLLLLCAAGLALTGIVLAQGPAQEPPPVFQATTRLVPVDVRVIDRNRRPVTNLTAADFTIVEDGLRQDISHFVTHAYTPDPAAVATAASALASRPTDLVNPDRVAPANRRVFLILFGRGDVQGAGKGIDSVLEFVRKRALPQDLVAVLAWNRATAFTTDHARIAGVVERFKGAYRTVDAKLRVRNDMLGAVYGEHASKATFTVSPALQADIDAVFGGPGAIDVRTAIPGRSQNAARVVSDSMLANDILQRGVDAIAADEDNAAAQLAATTTLGEFVAGNLQTMEDLGNLYLAIEYLRHLEGEKHLVFVSETGLALPRPEDDRDLARAAATGRVAIDYIHTGGMPAMNMGIAAPRTVVVPGVPPVQNPRLIAAVQSTFASKTANALATITGGTSFWNEVPAGGGMAAIDEVNRFQYVLGYYPSRPADGRFRSIVVRVNRPGVTALYRRGYDAAPGVVPFDPERVLTNSRISSAATFGDAIRDIPIEMSAVASASGRDVKAELRVDPRGLLFADEAGRRVASVVFAVWYFRGGDVVRQAAGKVPLTFTAEELARLAETGIPVSLSATAEQPVTDVKVVLYQYAADRVGSATVPVRRVD